MKRFLFFIGSLVLAISLFVILNHQSKAMASCGGDDTAAFITAGSLDCGDETYFYDPRNSADHGGEFIVFERYPANDREDRIVITGNGEAYLIPWRDCQSTACGDPIDLSDYNNALEPLEEGGTEYCSIILRTNCLPVTASNIFNAAASVARPPLIDPARYTGPVPEILRGEGPNSLRGIILARAASEELDDSCEEQVNNPLSFILCPLLRIGTETVDQLTDFLEGRLKFTPITDFESSGGGNPIQQGFNRFRNLANSLYILIFLVIILSNFVSVGLDNYSIKKMLPRLLVAVIGTQFAFLICSLVVDLSNVLVISLPNVVGTLAGGPTSIGEGLAQQFADVVSGTGATRLLAGTAAVIFILIICIVLIVIILIALAYIIFRNVFLLILVFLSPVAIAAWVLPQTQTFAKKWGLWFVKLIVMGPIISLILAITLIVQDIFSRSSDPFMQFVAFLVPFIGFLLIPKSLKWSGDVVGAAGRIGKGQDYIKEKGKKSAKEGKIAQARGVAGETFGRTLSNSTGGRLGSKMEARGKARREAPNEELKKSVESLDFERQVELSKKSGKAAQIAKRVVGAKQNEILNKRMLSSGDVDKLTLLHKEGKLDSPKGVLTEGGTTGTLNAEVARNGTALNPFWNGNREGTTADSGDTSTPLAPPVPPPGGGTSSSRSSSGSRGPTPSPSPSSPAPPVPPPGGGTSSSRSSSGSRGPTPSPSPSSPAPSSSSPSSRWRAATPRPNPAGTSGPRVIPGTGGAVDLSDLGGGSTPPEPPPGTTE